MRERQFTWQAILAALALLPPSNGLARQLPVVQAWCLPAVVARPVFAVSLPPGVAPRAQQAPAARAADDVVPPGKWGKSKPPAGWVVSNTSHYQVQSQVGKEKAAALSAHLEAMHDLYQRFLPMRRTQDAFVLKLFRDRNEYLRYSGDEEDQARAAYFDPEHGELVAFDTGIILGHRDVPAQISLRIGVADRLTLSDRQRLDPLFEAITDAWTMDTARVLSHEGWHQYFRAFTISVVEMPAWLEEGIGDWFFTATRDGDRDATHGYRLGEVNQLRLRTLRRAMAEGTTVSFGTMLGYGQKQYYVNPAASYAQGWSMVHFLMQHVDKRWRALIPALLADFKDTKNFPESTAKVFQGIDLEALDREWSAWVLSQPLHDPMLDLAHEFGGRLKAGDFIADKRWTATYQWYVGHPTALTGPAPEEFPAEPTSPGAPGDKPGD